MLVAVLIIGLVLLQRGKGADAGTGFGAGASATVFGARGSANFLSRATAVLVTLFFATSLSLAFLAGQQSGPASLLEQMSDDGAEPIAVPAPDTTLPELPIAPDAALPALPASPAAELPELPVAPADTAEPAGESTDP
jgi:preprotein translocase subunit SecG